MKILVTGGAGFIGSHVVDAYIKNGHHVAVLDNLSTGKREFVSKRAKFYKADVRSKNSVFEIVESFRPDIINHHAAQISVRASVADPVFDAKVNLLGILNLCQSAVKYRIKKIIFASSGGAVYGEAERLPTPENYCPMMPLSPYAVTKLASEHYLNFYDKVYKIAYVALRYSNIYGPRQNPHGEAGVVAIFSLKFIKGEASVINGDGRQTRDYLYVKDAVEANILATRKDYVGSINIGTGQETDVNTIYSLLAKLLESNIKPRHGAAKKGEQMRSCLDVLKAEKVIGWKPQTMLISGLEKTIEYFQDNSL